MSQKKARQHRRQVRERILKTIWRVPDEAWAELQPFLPVVATFYIREPNRVLLSGMIAFDSFSGVQPRAHPLPFAEPIVRPSHHLL